VLPTWQRARPRSAVERGRQPLPALGTAKEENGAAKCGEWVQRLGDVHDGHSVIVHRGNEIARGDLSLQDRPTRSPLSRSSVGQPAKPRHVADRVRSAVPFITVMTAEAIGERLATDPWLHHETLSIVGIERWTILLDGIHQAVAEKGGSYQPGCGPSGNCAWGEHILA
jgi:hypothetical protein